MAAGDVTLSRAASAAVTITLGGLATSSTWVAGRESTAIASADPTIDYLLAGKITVGTTPTANTYILVYVYGSVNDTPTYPDVLDGTDSAETFTSVPIRNSSVALAATMFVDVNTSDRAYWFGAVSVASLFGGVLPKNWGVFVTHNTGVNLNATDGNHVINYTPVYANVVPS